MRIDCHVHLVGNGLNGSGCRLKLRHPYHRLLAQIMLKNLGLPGSVLSGSLEEEYTALMAKWRAESTFAGLVLLAHEQTYSDSGEAQPNFSSLFVPNSYLLQVCSKVPGFLPGVSIHPARADAIDELNRCAELGAVLMKCLPNVQNIDCSAQRYKSFWYRMAELKLPLLAHTGGELSLPVANSAYANPETLRLPLECGVTVIAAHCGSSSHYLDRNYLPGFLKLLKRYPNLYGDNSGMVTPLRSRHLSALLDPAKDGRIVHGSDLPIPSDGRWLEWRKFISPTQRRECSLISNLLERDFQLKLAMGFPARCGDVFGELAKIRLNI